MCGCVVGGGGGPSSLCFHHSQVLLTLSCGRPVSLLSYCFTFSPCVEWKLVFVTLLPFLFECLAKKCLAKAVTKGSDRCFFHSSSCARQDVTAVCQGSRHRVSWGPLPGAQHTALWTLLSDGPLAVHDWGCHIKRGWSRATEPSVFTKLGSFWCYPWSLF